MKTLIFHNGTIILENRVLPGGYVRVDDGRITAAGPAPLRTGDGEPELIDLQGGYLAPGFVDLHVHGGAGADFMDGTADAFHTACRAHARHGTTSLLPTTTVARHEQHLAFLEVCGRFADTATGSARNL